MRDRYRRVLSGYDSALDSLSRKLTPHAVSLIYVSLGLVFFYFGLQKPLPVSSPVAGELSYIAHALGLQPAVVINFVGFYEMALGILFLVQAFRPAFLLFAVHQTVALLSLAVLPYSAFQPPWITLAGLQLPWVLGGYAAFVLKNLVFIAAVIMLLTIEYGGQENGG